MIVHSLDELLAVVFDQYIEDRARAFRTAVLCDDALVDDACEVLEAAQEMQAEVLAQWRAGIRAELAAESIRFPLRLTFTRSRPPS